MEDRKSSTNGDDPFVDALDEFPFYDCIEASESESSSISEPDPVEANASVPEEKSETSPEISSAEGLRHRQPFLKEDISLNDSKESNANFSVSFKNNDTAVPRDRKYGFSRNLMENERINEKLEAFKVRLSSGSTDNQVKEEAKENSTVTAEEDERIDYSVTVDSQPGVVDDSASSNLLLFLAGLVVKALGFQINLLVSFITFPIWLLYCSCVFLIDPFRAVRRVRQSLKRKLLRIWGAICENLTPLTYQWLKEQKPIWMLALRLGWGLLWSIYVCFILVSLLVSAFLISGFMMSFLVSEPIRMKETLNFDYTENSPVAFVPIVSCSAVSCGVNCIGKTEIESLGQNRIIPTDHKLKVTVLLTLPESDYNRNLGNFQVKVDFLSINGKTLQSSRRPCMLHFKSEPIRILLTFFKIAPLITGYSLESQTLNIQFKGFKEKDTPTSCLRVTVEQRAEFRPGAGIPEIYAASLALESELPLLKRILWNWKTTIFIWFSMMMFCMELLFTLLCCKPIIIPSVRLRGGSSNTNTSQNSARIRR